MVKMTYIQLTSPFLPTFSTLVPGTIYLLSNIGVVVRRLGFSNPDVEDDFISVPGAVGTMSSERGYNNDIIESMYLMDAD